MIEAIVSVFSDHVCQLGEGPSYDPATDALFWFDIVNGQLLEKQLSGGATNVQRVDAASSAVRVAVRDDVAIDEAALAALGLRGLVRPGNGVVHLLVGPSADHLAQGLRALAPLG